MFLQHIKKAVYCADLFCSSQLLRYNSDTQYNTLTGGLISLSIIIVIVVGFASMIANTLNRSTITSTLTTLKMSNPSLATLVAGEESMFMLSVSIQSVDLSFLANLSQPYRYFDVQMNIMKLVDGWPSTTPVALEQCTYEHWKMMPEFSSHFDGFGGSSWLCLPLGYQLPIQGIYTSATSYQVQIMVYPCRNQTSTGTCASEADIRDLFKKYGNFYLTANYINPVINPTSTKFMDYYLQGNDYIIFSDTIGSQAWIYFSDYTISTDKSIWPYSNKEQQQGCIVEQKAINHPYSVTGNLPYAYVYLARSENSLIYDRQVQKISAVFSYIGGLVGALTALLFLVKSYTDSSLEVTIGLHLFESQQNQQNQTEQQTHFFNFFGYIRLTFYRLMRSVGWNGKCQFSEKMEKYQDEALKQLDVQILLRRLIKLQTCMTHLFTPEQLEKIKKKQHITLESAHRMRTLLLRTSVQRQEAQEEKQSEIDNLPNDLVSDGGSHMDSGMSINHQEDPNNEKEAPRLIKSLRPRNSEEEELKRANELLQQQRKNKTRKPYRVPLPLTRKIMPVNCLQS